MRTERLKIEDIQLVWKALSGISSDISEPLLRLKVKQGNEDQQVLAECLYALIRVNPENSIGFLFSYLTALTLLLNRRMLFVQYRATCINSP
jgi:hypothetical protein